MKYEFQCDHCGRTLNMEAWPGEMIRCPQCGEMTFVPAMLALLEAQRHEDQADAHTGGARRADKALAAVGSTMPWVFSGLVHAGAFLVLMLVVLLTVSRAQTGAVSTAFAPNPGGEPGRYEFRNRDETQVRNPLQNVCKAKVYPRHTETTVEPVPIIQRDSDLVLCQQQAGGLDNVGLDPKGVVGSLFGGGGGCHVGGAIDVVYVADRSGSMAGMYDDVKTELLRSVANLKPGQYFDIVMFGDDRAIEGPGSGMMPCTTANKLAASKFLNNVDAKGPTTVLPALKRAFAVLASRPAREGKLIFLVSDGDFAGMSGGSQYRTTDGQTLTGNEAVLQWLEDNNKDPKVTVHTFLLHSADAEAVAVLKKIADSNGGQFKLVSADE